MSGVTFAFSRTGPSGKDQENVLTRDHVLEQLMQMKPGAATYSHEITVMHQAEFI